MALKAAQPHPARRRREAIEDDARIVDALARAIAHQHGGTVSPGVPPPSHEQIRVVLYLADQVRTMRAQRDPASSPPSYHRPSGHSQADGSGELAGLDADVRDLRKDEP